MAHHYMDLQPDSVKRVLPPASSGVDDPLLEDFLFEAELRAAAVVGSPLPGGLHSLRGAIRDLAAGRALIKLYGAENDSGRQAGLALIQDAMERLKAIAEDVTPVDPDPTDEIDEGLLISGLPHQPLFDPKAPIWRDRPATRLPLQSDEPR